MKIMHIDTSAKIAEKSNSRMLGQFFIEQLKIQNVDLDIDYLDLTKDVQPHLTSEFVVATYKPENERTPEMKQVLAESDAMCQRVLDADALVCAMPMYNWTIPATFKTFIDTIIRTGVTYDLFPDGTTKGKLIDKKVLFITTRGADLRAGAFQHMDAMTPVLKASFGFLGVDHPQFVDAQPLQFSDQESRLQALARAKEELTSVAKQWASEL
ncbi:FMN-dependent NADH-azoreductase [Commensalibacter communis]|uniref:FMN dependent NADH:quinone oxidoreductase n=1 Tax=Commensalibacter communis TaxID=2972786 RepID=A0A9W4TNK8_9PROT|nr:NAD(P)H-dependent oxidoreductase [Commensalibacter communis]CAI3935915.1 FMN-dependent NADH-azoreductase (AzoR) (PDB:1TIK) [Commensalibacter communis]CAI3937854.1 FMN-dependent NADH-azoreductase (AzoR) (PDB:1TIK) [Commensalibacter communis]CAI3942299.1 FMN-dependent NADH-azoreductase (AzoR) (PDB:1TIK) [Commensalibacter communis]CAI3942482.1 FMN-dependent NADH-azoreductase (AzoR) (PDB:1TIK) [Commensalibacter communis]CAI3944190.1 FMN-dependent NADH-azoreductase (AzoR) (PDB:1TIK) [Commensalib